MLFIRLLLCHFCLMSCFGYAYFSDWVVDTTNLNRQPILVQSLARQNSDTILNTNYIVRGMQVVYDDKQSVPKLKETWRQRVVAPVSRLTYVGKPDYPFPDRWPCESHHAILPENATSSQKYSNFKLKMAKRVNIVYQIDGNLQLRGFDVQTGNLIVNLKLTTLLNIKSSNQYDLIPPTPELTTMDVFFNQKWHSVLVGVVGQKKQFIFCLDVTTPQLLTQSTAHQALWWSYKDTRGGFSKPTIIRGSNHQWQLVIGQIWRNSKTLKITNKIHLFSLGNAQKQQTILLPTVVDSRVASRNFFLFTPIDSQGKGYADYLYVADKIGNLWKFGLATHAAERWKASHHHLLFSMRQQQMSGEILTQPKAIAHPDGGVVLSFLAKYFHQPHGYLISLRDYKHKSYRWHDLTLVNEDTIENWYKPIVSSQENMHILSNRVVSVLSNHQIAVLDVYTGKKYQDNNTGVIPQTTCLGEPIIFFDPKNKHSFFLYMLKDEKYAWVKLDVESDKLGRRIWRQL